MLDGMKRIATLAAVLGMLSAGCLSRSHRIPKRDLMALSQVDPEERGRSVRVIQSFDGEESPPEQRGTTSTTVVVVAPGPRGPARSTRRSGGSGGKVPGSAKDSADKAWVWVILAVGVGIGLAASEGARYDGWVELHPMHPVHLFGPHGEYTWMPLAHVDPETAAWARKAIVRPGEGPWRPLGRAPLNRVGFAYGVTLGTAQLPSIYGPEDLGFMSHIQVGYYPAQQLGLLLDFGLGWGQNSLGATIFDARNALELQFLPLSAGKFHAGLFGQIGIAARVEDGPKEEERRDTMMGGGVMGQLELTTRLAITARGGVTRMYGEQITDIGIGISVY